MFRGGEREIHYVIETVDGEFKKFLITPYRNIKEKDLISLKTYTAKGNRAEEVPDYLLKFYGLEKEVGK